MRFDEFQNLLEPTEDEIELDTYLILSRLDSYLSENLLSLTYQVIFAPHEGESRERFFCFEFSSVYDFEISRTGKNPLVFDVHPLIMDSLESCRTLYFRGAPDDVNKLIFELYESHCEMTQGWIPFEDVSRFRTLLSWGYGKLMEGPVSLASIYAQTLENHGVVASLIETHCLGTGAFEPFKTKKPKVFTLEDSYVIFGELNIREIDAFNA